MIWHIFVPETPWPLLIVRGVVVYAFLLVALRVGGRRELGQMTSFDLILLLILSNAVQNSMNAGDNSLGAGLISAATLLTLNWLVGALAYRSRPFEKMIQGSPSVIVTDGKIHARLLRRERITLAQLRSALRKQGISHVSDCQLVVLEPDGTFTAVRRGVEHQSLVELSHVEQRR